MRFDPALALRDRIQNFGDAVADIVAHDITHKQTGQQNADNRINQQPVVRSFLKMSHQQLLDGMDEKLEKQCGHRGGDSYQKTDEKNKGTLFDMLFAPEQKFIKSSFVCQCCQFILLSP